MAAGRPIAAVAAFALIQFAALSVDAVARQLSYPLWQMGEEETEQGQATFSPFARGYSLQQPASGSTDPGYWVAPDILQYVEEHRDNSPAKLGILVNTQQVNPKPFVYLVYSTYSDVQSWIWFPPAAGTTSMPNCSTPTICC